jgi:hypothetical protein
MSGRLLTALRKQIWIWEQSVVDNRIYKNYPES